MSDSLVFEVPLPPRQLSSNGSHGHWRGRAMATAEYRQLVGWLAKAKALAMPVDERWPVAICGVNRVSLVFGVKGSRKAGRYAPRDEANAVAAFKAGFDGLVDAGLLVDDSRRYMELGEVVISSAVGPFVRVIVTPVASSSESRVSSSEELLR